MVYPKHGYPGQAYKANVPFHLRRQLPLRKPRCAYNVYNMISDDFLWELYLGKNININELYFNFSTLTAAQWTGVAASSQATPRKRGRPKNEKRNSTSSKNTMKMAKRTKNNSSSSSVASTSQDEKIDDRNDSDSAASKKEETSSSSSSSSEEAQAGTNEIPSPMAWNDDDDISVVQDDDTTMQEDVSEVQDDVTPMQDNDTESYDQTNRAKKRMTELDNLYLPRLYLPKGPERNKTWEEVSKDVEKALQIMIRLEGLDEYNEATKRAAAKIEHSRKLKSVVAQPQSEPEPGCSSSSSSSAVSQQLCRPGTSAAARNETIVRTLSDIMQEFFSSMPGQQYKRPSMKLRTQIINDKGEMKWICPSCEKEEGDDHGEDMISCDKCGDWYHFRCVGIQGEYQDDRRWYCRRCIFRASKNFKPDDFPLFE